MSLRKEEAYSSSSWLGFVENNCTQGNGVLEVHSQKTTSFGAVGKGNQQPDSSSSPTTAMRSSPPVCARQVGRGLHHSHHLSHPAINHAHSHGLQQTAAPQYHSAEYCKHTPGVSRAIPGKNEAVISYTSSNTKNKTTSLQNLPLISIRSIPAVC